MENHVLTTIKELQEFHEYQFKGHIMASKVCEQLDPGLKDMHRKSAMMFENTIRMFDVLKEMIEDQDDKRIITLD